MSRIWVPFLNLEVGNLEGKKERKENLIELTKAYGNKIKTRVY